MTLNDKILNFINKGTTKARMVATELIDRYDREGYQSQDSEDRLLMLYELRKFSFLLLTTDRGGMTDKEVSDTIDFFWEWCELSKLSIVSYTNYQSIIQDAGLTLSGSFATTDALNTEITNRITNDTSLSNRITVLEASQPDPATFFPDHFFDNLVSTNKVVFDDDPRLHTHANKAILDQIDSDLLDALLALAAHYASIGNPSGVHVSSDDRTAWNAKVSQTQLASLSTVYAAINHTHTIAEITGLESVINGINSNISTMAGTDGREIELQRSGDEIQWRFVGDPTWISLGSFKGDKGDTGESFQIDARGDSVDRFSASYDSKDAHFTYLEEDTGYLYFRNPLGGSATLPAGWNNGIKFLGNNGWSPLLAIVEVSSTRSIFEIVDWVGGQGTKPSFDPGNSPPNPIRWFIGPMGITLMMSQASNIKGPTGNGTPPIVNAVGNIAGRSAYDDKPGGFIYMRNDVSPRTIFQKLDDADGNWGPELPWQGPPGSGGSGGGSFVFTQDIPVVGTTAGKYVSGDTIPSTGKTTEEVFLDMYLKYIDPLFSALGITGQSLTVEVGTTLSGSKTFTWTIVLGSGAVGFIDVKDVTLNSLLAVNTPHDGSQAITINTKLLNTDGATQQFQLILHDTNTIQDIGSAIITITSHFPVFYGPISATPTDNATVRAMPSTFLKNGGVTFILNSGTTLNKFGIWVENTNSLVSVFDLDASDANITSDYVLIGTINITDPGGTSRTGKYYELNLAGPYSSNHRHSITLS